MSSSKQQQQSKNAVDLTQKTFFLMSGASRGIGRTMAIECAAKMATGSVIVLIARSTAGLEETKAQILAKNPSNVTVFLLTLDLTRPTAEQISSAIFDATLSERNLDEFKLAMIVHNVGSIGDVKRYAKDFSDIDELHDYFAVNVFSVIALNSEFLKRFGPQTRRLIVNVTSKLAHVPCKSLTQYCTGKAAREMYFRTLALEEAECDPALTVLNYAPGPVQTEMTQEIENNAVASDVRNTFRGLREEKTMLQPIDTTIRFLKVIETVCSDLVRETKYFDFSHPETIMDSTFGKSFLFLTKLAWNCKVTLPVLVTAVFLAMDFRMQIELNIETEQLVFQDEIDDSDEYDTVEESESGDDEYEYDIDNSITS